MRISKLFAFSYMPNIKQNHFAKHIRTGIYFKTLTRTSTRVHSTSHKSRHPLTSAMPLSGFISLFITFPISEIYKAASLNSVSAALIYTPTFLQFLYVNVGSYIKSLSLQYSKPNVFIPNVYTLCASPHRMYFALSSAFNNLQNIASSGSCSWIINNNLDTDNRLFTSITFHYMSK